jgi:hypothetical protein
MRRAGTAPLPASSANAAAPALFTSEGHSALGLSVTGSLIDLLVGLLAFSNRPSLAVRAAKTYVLAQVGRTAA